VVQRAEIGSTIEHDHHSTAAVTLGRSHHDARPTALGDTIEGKGDGLHRPSIQRDAGDSGALSAEDRRVVLQKGKGRGRERGGQNDDLPVTREAAMSGCVNGGPLSGKNDSAK
jgi:hypothetical protein